MVRVLTNHDEAFKVANFFGNEIFFDAGSSQMRLLLIVALA
jgi:hypothetical protein